MFLVTVQYLKWPYRFPDTGKGPRNRESTGPEVWPAQKMLFLG